MHVLKKFKVTFLFINKIIIVIFYSLNDFLIENIYFVKMSRVLKTNMLTC